MHKHKTSLALIFFIQLSVAFYTLSGVAGKYASTYPFLSFPFIALYGAEIIILGVYALLWQQIIKRTDLSVAYANRSLALMWSLLWSVLFFQETITVKNIIGAIFIVAGVAIINTGNEEGKV